MRRWGTGGSRGKSSGGRSGGWTGKATSGGVTAYWKHRESLTKTISGKSRGNLTIKPCYQNRHLRRHWRLKILPHYLHTDADAMLPRVTPLCSSSALHERVWYLPPPSVVVLRALLAAVGRCRSSSRALTRLGGRRFALAHSGSGDHRMREDGVALLLQRRKSQGFGARMDAEISTEFPRRWLRQQLCAQAAPSCPRGACGGSMLLGASKQRKSIFCEMTVPVYCDGPKRERARRLQRAVGERSSAARGNSAAPPPPSSFPKHTFHGLE